MNLFYYAKLVYYQWALANISPTHPDVPHIVVTINQLESLL